MYTTNVYDQVTQLPTAEMQTTRARGPTAQEETREKRSLVKMYALLVNMNNKIKDTNNKLIETNNKGDETNCRAAELSKKLDELDEKTERYQQAD